MQVKEVGSGASQPQMREKLIDAARRREIDELLVWRLDRWGRSVTDLLATLQELERPGVGFVPLTEALDLTTPAPPWLPCSRSSPSSNAKSAQTRSRWSGSRPAESQNSAGLRKPRAGVLG